MGTEFVVATSTGIVLQNFDVASDRTGNFTVAWQGPDGPDPASVSGRRYAASGAPRGAAFRINTYTTGYQQYPVVASDPSGNVIASWASDQFDTQFVSDVYGQRYGGLLPTGLSVGTGTTACWTCPTTSSCAPRGATSTAWRRRSRAGRRTDVPPGWSSPCPPTPTTARCRTAPWACAAGPCFSGALPGTRPAGHVDAPLHREHPPGAQGQAQRWTLHVGDSFTDVPRTNPFYRFVETLLHHGVTSGCGGHDVLPGRRHHARADGRVRADRQGGPGLRAAGLHDAGVRRRAGASPFCRWIEELARRGVTGGCGGRNYCPQRAGHARADGGVRAAHAGSRAEPARVHARRSSTTCRRRRRSALDRGAGAAGHRERLRRRTTTARRTP